MNATEWIERLQLQPHPEGGYYRETFHASSLMTDTETLQTYGAKRHSATAIYFLLEAADASHFHRLKSDELWFYHDGDPLTVHVINPNGLYHTQRLGLDISRQEQPYQRIPRDHIFGATAEALNGDSHLVGFSLVSCVVTPGFDFEDFELFEQDHLLNQYPQHEDIIRRLTKPQPPFSVR